jgi:VWFA-related protein
MRLLIGLILLSLLPAGSYSQAGSATQNPASSGAGQQPQTVLRSNTRLVVVDVVATDGKGAPVSDLRESDFAVFEDGRPQRVGSFTLQSPGSTPQQPAAAPQLPQNIVSNVPRHRSTSLNVILLDRVNGESRNRVYAQDRLVKYLEGGAAIQPTAIFILDKKLALVHDFTSDTKVLKDALNGARPGGVSRVLSVDVAASPYATKGDFHTNEHSVEVTLAALKLLAKTLAGYPGRKNLIWVSEAFPVSLTIEGIPQGSSNNAVLSSRSGLPINTDGNTAALQKSENPPDTQQVNQSRAQIGAPENFTPGAGKSYAEELAKIADALMDAHVALYPIDAAGMGSANRIAAQSNMRDMADRTGGRAFYNRNDIEVGIGSSIDDGSTYYALSYYPENRAWDGRFRRIEVKTSRPGVNLRYRLGYYALDPEASARQDSADLNQEFAHAMAFDSPLFAGVRFQAAITPPADKSQKVLVLFAIDPHSIVFESKDNGLQHVAVSCSVAVYSEKGEPLKGFKEEVTTMSGDLKPEDFQRMMQSNLPCKRTLDLKPGKYLLRLGAVDRNGHMLGTSNAPLVVP